MSKGVGNSPCHFALAAVYGEMEKQGHKSVHKSFDETNGSVNFTQLLMYIGERSRSEFLSFSSVLPSARRDSATPPARPGPAPIPSLSMESVSERKKRERIQEPFAFIAFSSIRPDTLLIRRLCCCCPFQLWSCAPRRARSRKSCWPLRSSRWSAPASTSSSTSNSSTGLPLFFLLIPDLAPGERLEIASHQSSRSRRASGPLFLVADECGHLIRIRNDDDLMWAEMMDAGQVLFLSYGTRVGRGLVTSWSSFIAELKFIFIFFGQQQCDSEAVVQRERHCRTERACPKSLREYRSSDY